METSGERKCPKCGTALLDNQVFCPNCGKKYGLKTKNKLLLIIVPSISVVMAAVGITIAVVLNSPINVFSRCLNSSDFETAIETYNNNLSSEDFRSKADKRVEEFTSSAISSFAAGLNTEEYVETMCSKLSEITDVSDDTALIENISSSKRSFKNAEQFETNGDYENAIINYLAVLECDTEFYSTAVSKISECKSNYSADIVRQAEELTGSKEFSKAKEIINSAIEFGLDTTEISECLTAVVNAEKRSICDDAISRCDNEQNKIKRYVILSSVEKEFYVDGFNEKVDSAKSEAEDFVRECVEDCISQKKYVDGYNLLDSLPDGLCQSDLDDMKSEIKSLFENEVLSEAKSYAESNNYIKAAEILNEAKDSIDGLNIDDKLNEYAKQANIQKILEYKNNVDVDYDEFEHTYFIQPNIISDFYDYYVIHALPQIYYKDGYVNYGIGFSFIRSDWIFTEKIIVDCDGKQNRFEVKYLFNDLRDVLFNGDIFEACVILHTEDNRSTGSVQNLTTMIENIAAAESVKIRFDGSDGNYDVELSDEEINAIVDTWELFEILNSDPDLISYFK